MLVRLPPTSQMNDLSELTEGLRMLGKRPPTRASRTEVMAALKHKHEGIQSVAAQVLGAWGTRDSVAPLRELLIEYQARDSGMAMRGVVVRQLALLVQNEDVDWVLDLYFSESSSMDKHELIPLVQVLNPELARQRLVRALSDADWTNRQAAVKAIGNMEYPDRRQLLLPLSEDPNQHVAKSARSLAREA